MKAINSLWCAHRIRVRKKNKNNLQKQMGKHAKSSKLQISDATKRCQQVEWRQHHLTYITLRPRRKKVKKRENNKRKLTKIYNQIHAVKRVWTFHLNKRRLLFAVAQCYRQNNEYTQKKKRAHVKVGYFCLLSCRIRLLNTY